MLVAVAVVRGQVMQAELVEMAVEGQVHSLLGEQGLAELLTLEEVEVERKELCLEGEVQV